MAIVDIWQAIASQWRPPLIIGATVLATALDYAGVKAGLELAGRVVTPEQWTLVQVMEAAATSALNGAG